MDMEATQQVLFISFTYSDKNARALMTSAANVARRLPRVRVVDGSALDLLEPFSQAITTFIKTEATALLAILTNGKHRNSNVLYEVGVAVGAEKKVVLGGDLRAIPSMLRSYDVVDVDPSELDWEGDFRNRLERKLRSAFQIRDDHFVEEKLRRRYSEEELLLLKDRTRHRIAIESIRNADLGRACGILENTVMRSPGDVDAFFLLSDVYYLRGLSIRHPVDRDFWLARQIATAEQGLTVDRANVLLRHSLARGYLRTGMLEDGRRVLAAIVQELPRYSVAFYDLACAYSLLGNFADVFRWLASAVDLDASWREFAKTDPDFGDTHLQEDERWERLIFPVAAK